MEFFTLRRPVESQLPKHQKKSGKIIFWRIPNHTALPIILSCCGFKTFPESVLLLSPGRQNGISASEDKLVFYGTYKAVIGSKTFPGILTLVNSVAITPDGKMAISASWDNTCIFNGTYKAVIAQNFFRGILIPVSSVAITPDGKMAISASYDKTCILWDIQSVIGSKLFPGILTMLILLLSRRTAKWRFPFR